MENGAKANEGLPHTRNQDGSDSIESEVETPLTWEKRWLWETIQEKNLGTKSLLYLKTKEKMPYLKDEVPFGHSTLWCQLRSCAHRDHLIGNAAFTTAPRTGTNIDTMVSNHQSTYPDIF